MPYLVVTLPCDDDEPWAAQLYAELAAKESDGYGLLAMTTGVVPVHGLAGIGAVTRYVTQLVLVFHLG